MNPPAKPDNERPTSLPALAAAEQACTRCPLYRDAIQAVPGEGPAGADFMLVGETPGDQEDRQGRPFVGPAGRLLDRALEDAGIAREDVYVTNAVKHFKFELRGKRRLHKKPNASEIDSCRWWLDVERALVKPKMVLALGVSAVRGLTGRLGTIKALRGRALELDDGSRLVVTVHPSALLRIEDDAERHAAYRAFVKDLEFAARLRKQAA
jgi:DNA polymerase